MVQGRGDRVVAFGPFSIDLDKDRLTRDGAPVTLGGRAGALLSLLAESGGAVVDKDQILRHVWPGLTVEDNNIQVQIATLRKTLGEGWIATVPGRGYRLVVAEPASKSAHPPSRPTLAVLPFVNLSGAPDQDYLADAMTEEVTNALSRVRWFQVVARSSAFAYKGRRDLDIRAAGRDLGARYLLEGSVQRGGQRIRLAGALIDAETGLRLWSDRFEGDLGDIFALQDHMSEAVVAAVEPTLRHAEITRTRARPTESLDAYDLYLQSLPLTWTGTRESYDQAIALLKRAVAMDAEFTVAKAFLTFVLMNRAGHGWSDTGDDRLGARLAREVLERHDDDPEVLRIAGHTLAFFDRDFDRGLAAVERALAIHPNGIGVLWSAGWVRCYRTETAQAVTMFTRALQLNPRHAELGYVLSGLGYAHVIAGDDAAAVPVLRQAIPEMPNWAPTRQSLAVALWRLGHETEARDMAEQLMAMMPRLRARPEKWAMVPGSARDSFLAALIAAGVPA